MNAVMIGAGNVAWTLAQALSHYISFRQVYSPTLENAVRLAEFIDAEPIDQVNLISTDCDFYLIAVADHALPSLVESLPRVENALWAHTSGGVDLTVLSHLGNNVGVFYPLQTFRRGKLIELRDVPFFIEGNTPEAEEKLLQMASLLSDKVSIADSEKRRILHIAGVLTCNFVNNLWATADSLLQDIGSDISVVYPLIDETLAKAKAVTPYEAQTGPARRGDLDVIRSHMESLSEEDAQMYEMMSKRILKNYGYEPDSL